ncbi:MULTISPECIES: TlpA disulfide reductase family protein [Shewanella]|uniref:Redoxin n=1 Tax=Shewanella bicestrii TaxID=2018305 RepID=A0A220UNC7_9GAMM|nr:MULTISPECIES: TlpA disulfide reductase family protein [Shewanella]QXN26853.1 TlpA family protein disulfide reductase [Shewanella putrefaciens]ASK69416.1 redoxin [Shewanella bicestrii]MCL1122062.1 TlpA family protein disulfide reductase [Shewanella seohaensis]MDH0448489.1 TlpA family protein disulfide reductase [Shewanella sp. GD04112]MDH1470213.1 TlpA family protein disulfide reductase [Shewanella sp. GD03713]
MKKLLLLLSLLSLGAQAAPSLEHQVFDANNQSVSLTEFKGKVVYVDFWASWCGPCRKSFPWMNAMAQKYREQGLAVVAINLDTDKALADEFLKQVPATFTVRFNPEGDVARSFDLLGMPSSFMFNRQGELVKSHVGFYQDNAADYEQELVNLLKE